MTGSYNRPDVAKGSMVSAMGNSQEPSGDEGNTFTRRQLITMAGGAGLASVVGCSTTQPAPVAEPAPPQTGASMSAASSKRADPAGPVSGMDTPGTGRVSGVMFCREAWGARPARPGGRPQTITRMTIHHSAVALPDNRGIVGRLQQHQRFHQDDKGWVDIAYHAAVDRNGNIFQLRETAIAGDTATDYDTTGHFLVLCEGNFDEEIVSEAQLAGAALACAWATRQFGISVDTLASHREVAPATECPGRSLQNHISSGDLKGRIAGLIASGFELRPLCGLEADGRIAAIVAGR